MTRRYVTTFSLPTSPAVARPAPRPTPPPVRVSHFERRRSRAVRLAWARRVAEAFESMTTDELYAAVLEKFGVGLPWSDIAEVIANARNG